MPINKNRVMRQLLKYNPGVLPSKPSPTSGKSITVEVDGIPPYKDLSRSIRNVMHPRYAAFASLREAAIVEMKGRAPFRGPVSLELEILTPSLPTNRKLSDYLGGIMDTLDGSHGPTFTYLPVVYEDDCQVVQCHTKIVADKKDRYRLRVAFLPDTA